MKAIASEKVAIVYGKKPKIKKGYYVGKFLGAKLDGKDGIPRIGTYGKQWILEFQVLDYETRTPITQKIEVEGQASQEKDVVLPFFVNYEYKKTALDPSDPQKKKRLAWDGTSFETAITSKGKITKIFEAMGWSFSPKAELDTDEFIGALVELNINDYDAKEYAEDGVTVKGTYKASLIEDIKALEGGSGIKPATSNLPGIKQADLDKKLQDLKALKEAGTLTEDGYKMAVDQLSKMPIID